MKTKYHVYIDKTEEYMSRFSSKWVVKTYQMVSSFVLVHSAFTLVQNYYFLVNPKIKMTTKKKKKKQSSCNSMLNSTVLLANFCFEDYLGLGTCRIWKVSIRVEKSLNLEKWM